MNNNNVDVNYNSQDKDSVKESVKDGNGNENTG
jgi:hypothetical protein